MIRPAGTAHPTRARARFRVGALASLAALFAGVLVTIAPAAHALLPCGTVACPVANDKGTQTAPFYATPFDVTLTINANPFDPAHDMGLMADDEGPSTTRIETGDLGSDTQSWNGATIKYTNNLNGSFMYIPDPTNRYSGIDTFTYCIVVPATGNDDCGTVYIDVVATARDDFYGTKADTPLTVNATFNATTGLYTSGLAANDLGIDPDTLTLDTTSAMGGTITDNIDGAFTYTPPAGFNGTDSFGYTGMDIDWDYTYAATVTIYVDGTPPLVTMSAPAAVTLATKTTALWSGSDPGPGASGVANYDEQVTYAPYNGAYAAWAWGKSATTATTANFSKNYGNTACYRVLARDRAGNTSAWARRCTSIPLRASSLSYSSKWTRVVTPAYFSGLAYVTATKGQVAVIPAVQATRMWLVATKCASCGAVQVFWNNAFIGNVNLASAATVRHALIPIATFPTLRAGTLRFNVVSANGRGVIFEGLAVLRTT